MRTRYLGLRLLRSIIPGTTGRANKRLNGGNSNIAGAVAHGGWGKEVCGGGSSRSRKVRLGQTESPARHGRKREVPTGLTQAHRLRYCIPFVKSGIRKRGYDYMTARNCYESAVF